MLPTATASHLQRAPRAYQIHTKPSFRTLPSVPPSYLAHNTRNVRRNQQKPQQTGQPDLCGASCSSAQQLSAERHCQTPTINSQGRTPQQPRSQRTAGTQSELREPRQPQLLRAHHRTATRISRAAETQPEAPGRTGVRAGASSASRAPHEAAQGAAPPPSHPPQSAPRPGKRRTRSSDTALPQEGRRTAELPPASPG